MNMESDAGAAEHDALPRQPTWAHLSTKSDRGEDGKATDIPTVLNPWTLNVGSMYAFPILARRSNSKQQSALRAHLPTKHDRANYTGSGLGFVMLIRYTDSPVGPYDELLLVPGAFTPPSPGNPIARTNHMKETFLQAHGLLAARRVTRIFVSTEASLRNGRRNWGIRKELADFTWTPRPTTTSSWNSIVDVVVRSRLDGEVLCDVALKTVRTWSVPARLNWLQGILLPPLEEREIDEEGVPTAENAWIQTVLGGSLRMQPASILTDSTPPSSTSQRLDRFPNLHDLSLWPGVHGTGTITFTATTTRTYSSPALATHRHDKDA
ncbi:hypothetical protein H310_14175 [Aphanomyces invadans]|uniref:Uncharacterized protein n=1 Tax=Aphanomyces invadans TaxID=157072 RepID=A0A024TAU0_9STRA|nr:hypothetical protein H310_14175 [Aphanomyces invadans]ETV91168.1 hypothetical protein H310_14175 [Aphanomyces invadans]|eukprot:XP_008880199.1 hypothetical protein H310_14175 [Aphanomyces invadans]